MANAVKKAGGKDLSVLKGNERASAYRLFTMPADQNRFIFTWEVFKRNVGKLVTVNLLTLVCLLPMIALFILRNFGVTSEGVIGAYSSNLGIGYPGAPLILGEAELAVLRLDNIYFAFLLPISAFTALGIAGATYAVQKMLRSDEEVRIKDFFVGIKENYLSALTGCAVAFLALFFCVLVWNYAGYRMVVDGNLALWIFVRVVDCILIVPFFMVAFWIIGVGSNYAVPPLTAIKYVFRFGFPLFVPSIVCMAIVAVMALPVIWLSDRLMMLIAYAWFVFVGFAAMVMVWSSFTDWAFDSYLDRLKDESKAQEKKAEETRAKESGLSKEERWNMLRIGGKSAYLSRAIQPVNEGARPYIPAGKITQEELAQVARARAVIAEEAETYAAAHAQEEKYVAYNKLFDEKEKSLSQTGKKGKKKLPQKPLY